METVKQFADTAAGWHRAVACNDNPAISGDMHKYSKALLLAAIRAGYADVDADAVYDVWADCMESIAYCVNYVDQRTTANKLLHHLSTDGQDILCEWSEERVEYRTHDGQHFCANCGDDVTGVVEQLEAPRKAGA